MYIHSCLGGTSSAIPCRAGTFNDAERSTSISACKVANHSYIPCHVPMYYTVCCSLALMPHSVAVAQQTAVTTHPSFVLSGHIPTVVMELPPASSVNRAVPVPMESCSGHALRGLLLPCLGQLIAPYVLMVTSVQAQAVIL